MTAPHVRPSPDADVSLIAEARAFLVTRHGFGLAFLRTSDTWRNGLGQQIRKLYDEARRLRAGGAPKEARLLERYVVLHLRDPLRPHR